MSKQKGDEWAEAKRRCRLSDEELRMAKELGFSARSLIRNIPSRSQPWKAPVGEWVRQLYERKVVSLKPLSTATETGVPQTVDRPVAPVIAFRNAKDPWPDHPDIPQLVIDDNEFFDFDSFAVPDEEDVDDQNAAMQRRQRLFRWAAQATAISMANLPQVQQVAAFGAVAQPLKTEVPRFREYRRHRIEILHECGDLDLAVWVTHLDQLREIQRALKQGLARVQDTPYGGVAHHQVDIHLFKAGSSEYYGRLCIFRDCPKPGKRECGAIGCGAAKFLQQFDDYRFAPTKFAASPKVILFERESAFLVRPPEISAPPVKWIASDTPHTDLTDEDVPF